MKQKQTYWLNARLQMWPSILTLAMTLTLKFQRQIYSLPYDREKCADCQETDKHIDWMLCIKFSHQLNYGYDLKLEFSRLNI